MIRIKRKINIITQMVIPNIFIQTLSFRIKNKNSKLARFRKNTRIVYKPNALSQNQTAIFLTLIKTKITIRRKKAHTT